MARVGKDGERYSTPRPADSNKIKTQLNQSVPSTKLHDKSIDKYLLQLPSCSHKDWCLSSTKTKFKMKIKNSNNIIKEHQARQSRLS